MNTVENRLKGGGVSFYAYTKAYLAVFPLTFR